MYLVDLIAKYFVVKNEIKSRKTYVIPRAFPNRYS